MGHERSETLQNPVTGKWYVVSGRPRHADQIPILGGPFESQVEADDWAKNRSAGFNRPPPTAKRRQHQLPSAEEVFGVKSGS